MRVLFVANKYDYGRPEQGYSFEHFNFHSALVHMGCDVTYFDFPSLLQKYGRDGMNRQLPEAVARAKPDLVFFVLVGDEFDTATIAGISGGRAGTVTLNWFCDDHWRFDNFSKHYAPSFDWVVTTARSAMPKYRKISYNHVIKSQWACNHFLYCKQDLPLAYDVTFIGQPHGKRREQVQLLKGSGIDIRTWGKGWDAGRISQDDMIRVFNQSRINLNFSNASTTTPGLYSRVLSLPFRGLGKALRAVAPGWASGQKALNGVVAKIHGASQFDQIKGRNFEVPGCGGFMLTGHADDLESYYRDGKEIVCFRDDRELIEKVRYYLENEGERESIAAAGYTKTLKEHTYVHRFAEIFDRIGLESLPLDDIMSGKATPGTTDEIF